MTTNANKGVYTLTNAVGNIPAGTVLIEGTICTNHLYPIGFGGGAFFFGKGSEYVTFTPSRDVVALPLDNEACDKLQEACFKDMAEGKFAFGEKYLFFQISDKTWRKATMERTSSDIGRLAGGFIVTLDASPKQKFNRLVNLNKAYGLGLTIEDIRAARDGVNS